MTKEDFTSYIKRQSYTEMSDDSIDIYWNFYNMIPVNRQYYEDEQFHIAKDLHEWNLIAMVVEPIIVNNLYKGRKVYFYRNYNNKWISVKERPLFTTDKNGDWECTKDGDKEFIAAVPPPPDHIVEPNEMVESKEHWDEVFKSYSNQNNLDLEEVRVFIPFLNWLKKNHPFEQHSNSKLEESSINELVSFAEFVQNDYYNGGIRSADVIAKEWVNKKEKQ